MSDLYNLAYISESTLEGDPASVQREIEDILSAAQRNNPAMGVTGALLYSGGYFCQVIEGSMESLEDLFETIQMDDRHRSVTVLHFEPADQRGFSEWAMALAGIDDDMRPDVAGIRASKDEIDTQAAGQDVVDMLEKLVIRHQSIAD